MTVPTVTIVPPHRDRLTYAVSGGTVVAASIVTPPSPHRHFATGDGPGDGGRTVRGTVLIGDRPPRIRLTCAVFAFGGRWGTVGTVIYGYPREENDRQRPAFYIRRPRRGKR